MRLVALEQREALFTAAAGEQHAGEQYLFGALSIARVYHIGRLYAFGGEGTHVLIACLLAGGGAGIAIRIVHAVAGVDAEFFQRFLYGLAEALKVGAQLTGE